MAIGEGVLPDVGAGEGLGPSAGVGEGVGPGVGGTEGVGPGVGGGVIYVIMPGVEGGLEELELGEGVGDGVEVTMSLKFDTATCVCFGGGRIDGAAGVVDRRCWLFAKH